MGRQVKTGLDYFPFNVKFFADIKVRKLIKYQGGRSISIYACLLCNIYENGYYIKWDNEIPFLVSEMTGLEEGYIKEVIKCCFNVGLFNKDIYESHGVLTSIGIQERYNEICKISKRKYQVSEFSLINSEEKVIYSEEIHINSEEIGINSGKSTQSKEKESKEKESKVNTPIIPQGEESENLFDQSQFQVPKQPEVNLSKKVAPKKVFIPPLPDAVQKYCEERKNGITGEEFVNFYQSKGWMVGKNKMIDWQAAVRTWEQSRKNNGKSNYQTGASGNNPPAQQATYNIQEAAGRLAEDFAKGNIPGVYR